MVPDTSETSETLALEQNLAQVKYWLEHKYAAIRQLAKAGKAKIWWGDEIGRQMQR